MSWNFRIIAVPFPPEHGDITYFSVREVYYDGKPDDSKIKSISDRDYPLGSGEIQSIEADLNMIFAAIKKPVLTQDDMSFPINEFSPLHKKS